MIYKYPKKDSPKSEAYVRESLSESDSLLLSFIMESLTNWSLGLSNSICTTTCSFFKSASGVSSCLLLFWNNNDTNFF